MHNLIAREDPYIDFLLKKQNMNRNDYVDLFSQPEYQETLAYMFKERFLQRQFQLTRSDFNNRNTYLKKMGLFELAYKKKIFPRIN